jgi:hypothetical protein
MNQRQVFLPRGRSVLSSVVPSRPLIGSLIFFSQMAKEPPPAADRCHSTSPGGRPCWTELPIIAVMLVAHVVMMSLRWRALGHELSPDPNIPECQYRYASGQWLRGGGPIRRAMAPSQPIRRQEGPLKRSYRPCGSDVWGLRFEFVCGQRGDDAVAARYLRRRTQLVPTETGEFSPSPRIDRLARKVRVG